MDRCSFGRQECSRPLASWPGHRLNRGPRAEILRALLWSLEMEPMATSVAVDDMQAAEDTSRWEVSPDTFPDNLRSPPSGRFFGKIERHSRAERQHCRSRRRCA